LNMKISIGFTGTQVGMTDEQKSSLKKYLKISVKYSEYHHGDCIGADEQFHKILEELGTDDIIIHPPIKNVKRAFCKAKTILKPKDYLERNKDIVDASEVLIATPKGFDEELRSGTWSTIRYCKKQKKSAFIIYPNGMMRLYDN